MANLLLLSRAEPGRLFPLQGERTFIGRDPACEIVIPETMVSRRHAIITCDGGKYYIEDGDGQGTRSRNRTFVNDKQVPFPGRVPLRNDDQIRICDFICTFHEEQEISFSVEASIDQGSSSHSLQAQPAEKLRVILEISNSLGATLDMDALLPRVVESLFQLFRHADRGFIILRDEPSGELVARVVKTRRAGEEPDPRFSASIVRQCLANRQAILGNDLPRQFPESESIGALPIRSLMCAPLWSHDDKPLGAIQLDARESKTKFTQDDLNLLVGVASQASIALSNARLHRASLAHQRRERDLELANQVQHALLPQRPPDVPGYEFYAYYESALEIGGDYYDFIPLPEHRLAVLLGDVAGKGVAAALVMVKFSVEARGCLLSEADPAAAVTKLNAVMRRTALSERFVTLVAAVLDPATHTVTLVNAGHPSPLLVRRGTGAVEKAVPLQVSGPPIGIRDDHAYGFCQVQLQPGDGLFLFSDGITDAMDAEGRPFAAKTALGVVPGGGTWTPRERAERLIQAVKAHAAGCDQNDDITLVCFGRTAP